MKPESEASGVRNSWLALATKSARISSTRRSGVRSWKVISTRPAGAGAATAIGVTMASYQRSTGTRSKNSTRCGARRWRARGGWHPAPPAPAARARPARRGAARARSRWRAALSATTSPLRLSATTGSGSPASTASISGSPTRATGDRSGETAPRSCSPPAAITAATATTAAKATSAGQHGRARRPAKARANAMAAASARTSARALEPAQPSVAARVSPLSSTVSGQSTVVAVAVAWPDCSAADRAQRTCVLSGARTVAAMPIIRRERGYAAAGGGGGAAHREDELAARRGSSSESANGTM